MGTVEEWLQGLANTNTSNENDSTRMENLLHRIGFLSARVVVGVVYTEGKGPPTDIHSMARMIIEQAMRISNENSK